MKSKITLLFLLLIALSKLTAQEVTAVEQTDAAIAEELAKKLANPVAALISVPIQNNFDFNVGPNEGFRYNANIQPVVPISIGENWNLISRTILPVISLTDVTAPGNNEFGIGDIVQSVFFSPKKANNGLVWGVGPIFILPTATDDAFASKKFGIGPNALALKLIGQWTVGALVNHTWSVAGDDDYQDISATFFQPFMTYATKTGSSFTLASENTQSWNNDVFGGFVGFYYAKVTKFGNQPIQLGGGPRVFYGNNTFNPDWGVRVNVILLFPKK